MTKIIVTHQNPDWDAIASAWLLKRYLPALAEAEIMFVNTGNPDQELLARADAVVDTGKKHLPQDLRFDHHHLPGTKTNDTCAIKQVYAYLKPRIAPAYLQLLVELVFQGDTGRQTDALKYSYQTGIHALLSGRKRQWRQELNTFMPDREVLEFGFMLLDTLAIQFETQSQVEAEFKEKIVYCSDDGLVVALKEAGVNASHYATEQGAVLVLFLGKPVYDDDDNLITQAIGIQRTSEWTTPDCGGLVGKVAKTLILDELPNASTIVDELVTWFRHNAGFFAGRGTGKAPVASFVPSEISDDFASFARLFDLAWER